jgi:hypothetical protein
MDHSPINQNVELNKSRQKFHHSLKEHNQISNIPKLVIFAIFSQCIIQNDWKLQISQGYIIRIL